MFDLLALLLAVVLLTVILNLRAIMARRYPTYGARLVDAAAPAPMADLYARADEVLRGAGFEGPWWVLSRTEPAEANLVPLRAVYRHHESQCAVWLMPALNVGLPNVLLTYWTTELDDGRVLTSQALDRYAELVANERCPAQTIHSADLIEQWQAHQRWRATFDVPARVDGLEAPAIVRLAGGWSNERLSDMVDRGLLKRAPDGGMRASWRFAWRMLVALMFKRTKAKVPGGEVPDTRLVFLAGVVERVRRFSPTRAVQWSLFLASLVLFLLVGGLVWDWRFVVILLVAVAFHESGHYFAMRAFGYRNVHMLALPLVGGVTIGEDADPSATRRAWMSLMGPLPGIVVGWALLLLPIFVPLSGDAIQWAREGALIFLILNYLNVLPVPPLDGGHVVQAMLPARWLNLQVGFVAIACVLGALIAWYVGFVLLAVIAGFQLLGLSSKLSVGRAARRLLQDERAARDRARPQRLLAAFEALRLEAGPAKKIPARIAQAEQVLQAIDLRPMSWWSRSLIAVVYGGLLLGPVLVGAMWWMTVGTGDAQADVDTWSRQQAARRAALVERAAHLSWAQLMRLEDSPEDASMRRFDPADDLMLVDTEQRLGVKLSEDLRAIYKLGNGSAVLKLTTLAGWQAISPEEAEVARVNLAESEMVFDEKGHWSGTIDAQALKGWLRVSLPDEQANEVLLIDLAPRSVVPGHRVHVLRQMLLTSYADMGDYARDIWVDTEVVRGESAHLRQNLLTTRARLRDADMKGIIGYATRSSLLQHILGFATGASSSAEPADIAAVEQRLSARLPDDMREFYLASNGLDAITFLPLQEMPLVSSLHKGTLNRYGMSRQSSSSHAQGTDRPPSQASMTELADCVVIEGFRVDTDVYSDFLAFAAWCPRRHDEVIDLRSAASYTSFREYLIDRVAGAQMP